MSSLGTPDSKSILLLVGVVAVGAVFIIAIALLSNRPKETAVINALPYSDPESGIVFTAPATWSVGADSGAFLKIRSVKLDSIQTQRSTCTNYSTTTSKSIQLALKDNLSTASETWRKEFPGLRHAETVQTKSGVALLGVDTCNTTLTRKTLTLRGQTYRNNTEVRFEVTLTPPTSTENTSEPSSSMLNAFADDLVQGTGGVQQATFTGFVQTLRSIE